jgi:RNA polymerase sigma-70 factor, ECF subfamily
MSRLRPPGVLTLVDRDTELALVERLRRGDTGAFDVVYDEYHGRIFNFLARLSRRRDVAEDLTEETWLRLVSRSGRLSADTRLAPWLFTVARNLYASYRRARLIEDSHATALIGLWPAGAPARSPFEETAANEADRRLESALAELPATSREVLILVGIEGLTPAEAAVVCGVSPEALRQRLSRARAQLAKWLDAVPASRPKQLQEAMS